MAKTLALNKRGKQDGNMQPCQPGWGRGNLEGWLQERWESGLGMNLESRKLCFNQLGVPNGPGRERVQERNKEGQVGHVGSSQLIK